MPYRIHRSSQARTDFRDFFRRLTREAGVDTSLKYVEQLEYDLTQLIANRPKTFNWFHETGAPYRAKLFRLVHTTYWIVYVVDDEHQVVEVLRFWNAARKPGTHGL